MILFRAFAVQSFRALSAYRFEFWLRLVSNVLWMYCAHSLWTVLYGQSPDAFGHSGPSMITYGVLSMALQSAFYGVQPHSYIANQMRTGAIDTDLMKPLDLQVHLLARSAGETLFSLATLVVPSLLLGYLVLDLQGPATPLAGLQTVLAIALAFLVLFGLNWLMGMLAVVILDISSVTWTYYSLTRFFGGQLVPIWLFPSWLAALAEVLPFKSLYYIPASVYAGQMAGAAAWGALGFQAAWALALWLIGRLTWRRLQARLVVQGG